MKKTFTIIGLLAVIIVAVFVFFNPMAWVFSPRDAHEPLATSSADVVSDNPATSTESVKTIVGNLSVPWGLAFLPEGNILLTERPGRLVELTPSGQEVFSVETASVQPRGEGGLLGIALHPNFAENRQLYVYETYEQEGGTYNRVVRYQYADGEISNQEVIISDIPGARYHDGGRIAFGPDKDYLYVTAGDAGNPTQAQSTSTLNGKVLRLHPDGSIPTNNPFGNPVYSYGHRNPQGLAWDKGGRLWSTEHGRSGVRSGLDEVNLIQAGGNYGWPYLEGSETCEQAGTYSPNLPSGLAASDCRMLSPVADSGPDITWAPASADIANNTLFFGGLRGQAVYAAPIQAGVELQLGEIQAYFKERLGRIRTVKVGPNETFLYITTSNTDGRGNPSEDDDKIIRIPVSRFK